MLQQQKLYASIGQGSVCEINVLQSVKTFMPYSYTPLLKANYPP